MDLRAMQTEPLAIGQRSHEASRKERSLPHHRHCAHPGVDMTIITGDQAGNIVRYTFTE